MRFSVASGTDNALLQRLADQTAPDWLTGAVRQDLSYGPQLLTASTGVIRLTYTVPAGRIARINHYNLSTVSQIVGTGPGLIYSLLDVVHSGPSIIGIATAMVTGLVVGENSTITGTSSMLLESADIIRVSTYDTTTGASSFYSAHISLTEIDDPNA